MLGTLTIQTDFDFGITFKGESFFGFQFQLKIDTIQDLFSLLEQARDLRNKGKKTSELISGLSSLILCSSRVIDTTGGNRGIFWIPSKNS